MMKMNFKRNLVLATATLAGLTAFGQGECTEFSYFYSDINYPGGIKQSDIYSVELEDNMALLSPISLDLAYGAHIAYNETSGLLFLVNDVNGQIQTLDPITGDLSAPVSPEINLSSVTTAAINHDGRLLVGSHNGNIYLTDLTTNPYGVELFDGGADISGGDITFTNNGLYLASKPNGYLYTVLPGMSNILLGNVDNQVTGIATYEDQSSIIVSSVNNDSFLVYEVGGEVSEIASYAAMLDGEPFTLDNGDMASGCSARNNSLEGCADYKAYYMHDAQGGGQDVLFSVELNEQGGANMTDIGNFPASSHLGVGPDELLYIVSPGKILSTFDPATQTVLNQVQIVSDFSISGIPAVVVGEDGLVYAASSNNKVFSVDPTTGTATFIANANVNGGDLVFIDGALWLANRSLGRFFEVGGEGQFDVDASEINGVASLSNGNLLIANGNLNSVFEVYEPYTGVATGETFNTGLTLFNGDLAGRCADDNQVETGCENFKIYLTDNTGGSGRFYEVTLDDENDIATLTVIREQIPRSHVALHPDGSVYLINRNGSIATYDPSLDQLSAYIPLTINGNNISNTHSAVVSEAGILYVGSSSANKVYEVDPLTGIASNPVSVPVQGGDLVQTIDGDIWVINRPQSRFYNITDGVSQFDVDAQEIYGAGVLESGLVLTGTANSNALILIDPMNPNAELGSYAMDLTMSAGDIAAGCVTDGGDVVPNPGNCYATELIEYAPGTEYNGNTIPSNRTDGNQALGQPERSEVTGDFVFASLGYAENGGHITLGFGGLVPNEEGDDLEIVETTWGNPYCSNEYADVYVSVDGVDFHFAKTVCKADGFVDISDAGAFDYIMYVKIVQAAASSSTDGYDVDGVVALHNCDEIENGNGDVEPPVQSNVVEFNGSSTIALGAYPNPTEGMATVTFQTSTAQMVTLEVLDMNGRIVETLFSNVASADVTYRADFNGLSLPNGIYVTKLTTDTETVINKLMITK